MLLRQESQREAMAFAPRRVVYRKAFASIRPPKNARDRPAALLVRFRAYSDSRSRSRATAVLRTTYQPTTPAKTPETRRGASKRFSAEVRAGKAAKNRTTVSGLAKPNVKASR